MYTVEIITNMVTVVTSKFLLGNLYALKCDYQTGISYIYHTQIEKSKDHIYLKNCSTCKSMYIGETGQYQKKRDQGHKADIKQGKKSNSFFMHLHNNKNHQIDWETTKILDNEKCIQK